MNTTILVVGRKEDYYSFVADKPNKKDFVHLSYDFHSLRGQNLKDVVFLKNWLSNYSNVKEMLSSISLCFRGEGYNKETLEKIQFAISTYQESYEDRIRIEHKVKKEFRDKEMSEWSNAGCLIIILFFSLIILAKCSVG